MACMNTGEKHHVVCLNRARSQLPSNSEATKSSPPLVNCCYRDVSDASKVSEKERIMFTNLVIRERDRHP